MPTDKKISELTPNTSITGIEEVPTERGGSNYKNTYTDLKTWILTGLGIGVNSVTGQGVGGTPTEVIMTFPNTSEVIETVDKNYVTDVDKVVLGNTSNVNTGDQDLSSLALKSNVLELDNTTVFTPSSDYEPATRKFVLDNAVGAGVNSVTGQGVSGTVADPIMSFPTPAEIGASKSGDNVSDFVNDAGYLTSETPAPVDSVNGKVGLVVLDTGDISPVIDKNYVTDSESVVIGNTSNTNTGDQDLSGLQPVLLEGPFVNGDKDKLDNIESSAEVNTINSKVIGEPIGSDVVLNIVSLTQVEYDTGAPIATTLYLITDA